MKNIFSNKQGYLQISFAWLFAIIVGALIISLAIYTSSKLIGTEQEVESAQTGKEIEILANILETGFESSKTTSFKIPLETRIKNNCEKPGEFEPFGTQGLQLAQKSFEKWSEIGVDIEFENRYLFSESVVEGKDFYFFSKPFDFPFKVSDVLYLTSSRKNYCFSDAPREIKSDILKLNQGNLITENCPSGSIQICFDSLDPDCDINVNLDQEYVEKEIENQGTQRVYFETDALMYGAIFSGPEIYECQVKRLMKRTEELSKIYGKKESLLFEKQECPKVVNPLSLANYTRALVDSGDLHVVESKVDDLYNKNNGATCRLW